jgi:L-alanine-DL-glutamate epimerase-like enolase superfamily enzyme
MRITGFHLYPLANRFRGGPYVTSYGPRETLNNLLMVVETDAGVRGLGEIARYNLRAEDPLSDAFRDDMARLLPAIIGCDPRAGEQAADALGDLPVERRTVRAAVDAACHDIAAQAADVPLHALLGGRRVERVPHYFSIGRAAPADMAAAAAAEKARGFSRFQVKIGEGPEPDAARITAVLDALGLDDALLADANGGFDVDTAARLFDAVPDARVLWEEPCTTIDENMELARRTGARIVLDQCLHDLTDYARACSAGLFAGCGLKPSLLGGISVARTARDLCRAAGVAMKIDDAWALEAATVASLHVALGLPQALHLGALDQWRYFETNLTEDPPDRSAPAFEPYPGPGLGFTVRDGVLGDPLVSVSQ